MLQNPPEEDETHKLCPRAGEEDHSFVSMTTVLSIRVDKACCSDRTTGVRVWGWESELQVGRNEISSVGVKIFFLSDYPRRGPN